MTHLKQQQRALVSPYFEILGQHEQLLQIALLTNDCIYTNGQIVYGSENLYREGGYLNIYRTLMMQPSTKLTRLKNSRDQVEYVGIKKGRGKVLVLDVTEYLSMYVDANRLLAINFEYDSGDVAVNPNVSNLYCFSPLRPSANDRIFLQGNAETYVEKELAEGEKMMTSAANLLCISKSIRISNRSRSSVLLEGPGLVFLAPTPTYDYKLGVIFGVICGFLLLDMVLRAGLA